MPVRSRLLALVVLAPLVVAVPSPAAGQAVTRLPEPLEYGVDERHDPFDYSQPTDLMTDRDVTVGVTHPRTQPAGMARVRAIGNSGGNWYVSPVWMTFPHTVDPAAPADALPDADGGALHDQHDGLALPVDADTYTHVSMRFHLSGDPGLVYLSWFSCQEWLPGCQGIMRVEAQRGWNTVAVPIRNDVPESGLTRPWEGTVHGLRLQGALADGPVTLTLDWFRLFAGGPTYEIEVPRQSNEPLTYSNRPTVVEDQSVDAAHTWGHLRTRYASSSTMTVDVGGLPVGRWYLHDDGVLVGEVEIAPRPRPEVLDPDRAGGVDYATEMLGNPWDFEDAGDVVGVGNARDVRWVGGELSAVNTTNDPFVQLPLGPDGLDPVHYHRVTVDQHYDSDFNLDDGDKATNPRPGGSHGRLLWRTPRHTPDVRSCQHVSDGREFVFYKTWDTYTYDMKDVPAAQGMRSSTEPNIGVTYCSPTGPDPDWTANGPITSLRFDPHEAPAQYRWYLDELRIAADDAAAPTFDITWVDHAPIPGTEVTVRVGDEVLARVPQTEGTNRVTFDATDRLPGVHEVSVTSRTPDGRVSHADATGPLQVSPRISGTDRVATAVEVSRQSLDTARTAIVASAGSFPDALVAVQLADAVEGPVLLTGSDGLDARVRRELDRLGTRKVVVVGGEAALGRGVEQDLRAAGVEVQRLGGTTRYETSILIAHEALRQRGVDRADEVAVTTGENFPDALAAGPWVGYSDTPLILARPEETGPENAVVRQFLGEVGARTVTALGGTAALSDRVVDDLARGRRTTRIAGRDRYETAQRLADAAVAAGGSRRDVLVATGGNFPDALSAGPAALARGGILVLTDRATVPAATRELLGRVSSWGSWRVVGGALAVTHATVRDLRSASGL